VSSSDKLTLENFHKYWDALVNGFKELKARVAKVEARLDQTIASPAPKEETEAVEEEAEL